MSENWVEKRFFRESAVNDKGIQAWNHLRAAVESDVESFKKLYGHRNLNAEIQHDEQVRGMSVMITRGGNVSSSVYLQYARDKKELIARSSNPDSEMSFTLQSDDSGDVFLALDGKRLEIALISQIILEPVMFFR